MPDIPAPVATQGVPQADFLKNYGMITEIQRNQAATQNIKSETYQRDYNTQSLQLARAAHDILAQPEGPDRNARWAHHVNTFAKQGMLSPEDRDYYLKSGPSDLVLNSAIRHGMDVEANMRATGTTQGLAAKQEAPWQFRDMPQDTRQGYPAQEHGNLGPQAAPGMIPGQGSPQPGPLGATAGPMAITGPQAGSALPGPQAPAPQPVAAPQPIPQPAPAPTTPLQPVRQATEGLILPEVTKPAGNTPAASGAEVLPPQAKTYYDEAPVVKTWPDAKTGPGIVNPGRHPMAVKAQEGAMKKMDEDINPAAQRATHTVSELQPLVAELERGNVETGRLADIKNTIAAYVYAGTKNYSLAKSISGVDIPEQEMAQKIMMTRGLKFDRETEGARMAVMAIQIGNLANPQMVATPAANLKMAKYLMAGAEYDKEVSNAALGYMQKQQDKTGTPHLIGFDQYINNTHPPSQYVSKIVPFTVPDTQGALMKNVTYEWRNKDSGEPEHGTWDGKRMVPQ